MTSAAKAKPTPPKGGKLGGAVFPRMTLVEGVTCAKRLVSKTHTASQPLAVIHSGVVQAKHGRGGEKVSALKQYGFLEGNTKDGFIASQFAKQLVSAPEPERGPHLRKAALSPKIFKALFETYLGDTVSKGKLKQRAAELNVHPEVQDLCIDMYTKSLALAGLVSVEGDQVTHSLNIDAAAAVQGAENKDDQEEVTAEIKESEDTEQHDQTKNGEQEAQDEATTQDQRKQAPGSRGSRAVVHVNISLDSSLDTDKLQKQLELLKKYGAI